MLYHLFDYLLGPTDAPWAYKDALFRGTCAILVAFLVVWFMGPRVIQWLFRRKIGDQAEFDHKIYNEMIKEKKNTPTMGGMLIISAIAVSVLLLADLTNYYIRMGLFCMVWLTVMGGVDDWLKLTARSRSGTRDGLKFYEKLLFQFGLGVLLGIFIYRHGEQNAQNYATHLGESIQTFRILSVPFYKHGITLTLPAFWIVTVLVTTGTSNAVNLTDGMDGLASGCVALCGFAFMILSFLVGDPEMARNLLLPHIPYTAELAVLCGAMVGACLGFLWYNCYPARVFMGDTGSLPLGGLIGYVAIVTRQELMLFIVGGVFVMEAVSVLLQVGYFKWSGGKRIFKMAPIHHHFHMKGWTETQTVTRFWLLAAVFAGIALATVRLR